MSFSMTTEQMRNRTKTITRRWGWRFLKPGDHVMAVEKAMGLKKGEKVVQLYPIEILSVRSEPLDQLLMMDLAEARLELEQEGFPDLSTYEFVQMLCKDGHSSKHPIQRIRFRELLGSGV